MAFSSTNNNLRRERIPSVASESSNWESFWSAASNIRYQLNKMQKDCQSSEKIFKDKKPRCIKEVLNENRNITCVLTNTKIIKSVLANPCQLSMSTLAGLLVYVQAMISSSYVESQDVAIKFLEVIKGQYWEDIIKTSKLTTDEFTGEVERRRVESARKAKDSLVNIGMNSTGTIIHNTANTSIFKSCADTFINF